jgi:hypothetical protein
LHLIDAAEPELRRAALRFSGAVELIEQVVDPEQPVRLGRGEYPLVISGLTLHVIAAWDTHPNEAAYSRRNQSIMTAVHASLRPGGVFIYADFIRHGLGVREHLALLEAAGFEEVDCAWRQDDLAVFGGARRE